MVARPHQQGAADATEGADQAFGDDGHGDAGQVAGVQQRNPQRPNGWVDLAEAERQQVEHPGEHEEHPEQYQVTVAVQRVGQHPPDAAQVEALKVDFGVGVNAAQQQPHRRQQKPHRHVYPVPAEQVGEQAAQRAAQKAAEDGGADVQAHDLSHLVGGRHARAVGHQRSEDGRQQQPLGEAQRQQMPELGGEEKGQLVDDQQQHRRAQHAARRDRLEEVAVDDGREAEGRERDCDQQRAVRRADAELGAQQGQHGLGGVQGAKRQERRAQGDQQVFVNHRVNHRVRPPAAMASGRGSVAGRSQVNVCPQRKVVGAGGRVVDPAAGDAALQ